MVIFGQVWFNWNWFYLKYEECFAFLVTLVSTVNRRDQFCSWLLIWTQRDIGIIIIRSCLGTWSYRYTRMSFLSSKILLYFEGSANTRECIQCTMSNAIIWISFVYRRWSLHCKPMSVFAFNMIMQAKCLIFSLPSFWKLYNFGEIIKIIKHIEGDWCYLTRQYIFDTASSIFHENSNTAIIHE